MTVMNAMQNGLLASAAKRLERIDRGALHDTEGQREVPRMLESLDEKISILESRVASLRERISRATVEHPEPISDLPTSTVESDLARLLSMFCSRIEEVNLAIRRMEDGCQL